MKTHIGIVIVAFCIMPLLGACDGWEDSVGGLTAGDFEKISLNGFDPADNAIDKNDYAWSMEFFQPDGDEVGYVYVGTGNNMFGLHSEAISLLLGDSSLEDVAFSPPEIRRYRGDVFPNAWERVLDYRDVEPGPVFHTAGFRNLKTYRAESDGVNYLYAGTWGLEPALWRTASGAPGTWEMVWSADEPGSIRWMEEHNGTLYLAWTSEGLPSDVPTDEFVGKVWATDGADFWPVIEDGFGNPDNIGIMCLISYNDWLYAGTANAADGCEIYKFAGPEGEDGPIIQVLSNGGGGAHNESAHTGCVFNGKLYFGTAMIHMTNIIQRRGADILRIDENDQWEVVVGRDSLSGYYSGFDHWLNAYIWWMAVHDGWLYASTYDQVSAFFNLLENMDELARAMLEALLKDAKRQGTTVEKLWHAGADLYKTQDGVHWYPVTINGLGDVGNYGFRVMKSVDDEFYIGTTNPFDGLEVWRAKTSTD